jgi:hypothetical protein
MKALSAYTDAKIASGVLDKWLRVSIAGSMIDSADVISYTIRDGNEWAPAEATLVLQNDENKYDYVNRGNIIQIEEGFDANGTVENFGGFYGVASAPEKQDDDGATVTISAYDLIGRLGELEIDAHYEASKTAVQLEIPQMTLLAAPNDYLAQVFDLANEAIAKTPTPKIFLTRIASGETIEQTSGFEIDYANGQIIFGNPFNITTKTIAVSYSYYAAADSQFIEDIIEEIIVANDGFGNAPFTASQLRETFNNMEDKSVDTMTPNYISETIDGTTYPPGRVWYLRYNNVTTTLAAGDFTVPGGTIDSISQRYGRIILTAAIPLTSVVTYNGDYTFKTIQASGVKVPVFHASAQRFKTRLEAIKRLCSILPPNYKIATKQISANKIWAEFQNQRVVADYTLPANITTRRVLDPGLAPPTRVVRYGRGQNPINRCLNVDAHIEPPGTASLDGDVWTYHDWVSGVTSAPTIANSAVDVTAGNILRTVQEVSARGLMTFDLRWTGPVEFAIGFFRQTAGTVPEGLVLYYCHHSLAQTSSIAGVVQSDRVRICDSAIGAVQMNELPRSTLSGNVFDSDPGIAYGLQALLNYSSADDYYYYFATYKSPTAKPGTSPFKTYNWKADRVNMPADGYFGIYVMQGTVEADRLQAANLLSASAIAAGINDHFLDVMSFTNRTVDQPLTYIGDYENWLVFTPGLSSYGKILSTPEYPMVFIDGLNLNWEQPQEITNASVTFSREWATRTVLGITFNAKDTYRYVINLGRTNVDRSKPITIYDESANLIWSIPANDSHVDYENGIIRVLNSSSDFTPASAFFYVIYSNTFRVDYERGLFLIKPSVLDPTWVQTTAYGSLDNTMSWEEFAGDESVIEDITFDGWERLNMITASFYYKDYRHSPPSLINALDGDYDTRFQIGFTSAPVKGLLLGDIDLGAEYVIDALDLAIDFYSSPDPRLGGGPAPKVGYSGKMTILLAAADEVFEAPSPELEGFDIHAGEAITFDRDALGDDNTVRFIRLQVDSLENVFVGEPPGIWPIAIAEISAYSGAIIKGEAFLVATEGEADSTHLYDEAGLLADLGDVMDKETRIDDFWGIQSDLDALCMGILSELYKDHNKMQVELPFAPHVQRGATIAMAVDRHGRESQTWYVEDMNISNGQRAVTLVRYP